MLGSRPSGDVVLLIASDTPSEGTPDVASLTITPDDWNLARKVTVTGVDDSVVDGTVVYHITTTVDAASAAEYVALGTIATVTLQNQDDDAAAILVAVNDPTSGEDGDTASVSFTLSRPPGNGNVTVPLALDSTGEASLDVSEIVIAAADWDNTAANTVTITGLDDDTIDGSVTYRLLTGDPVSASADYDALDADDVADPAFQNADDDVLEVAFLADAVNVDESAGEVRPRIVVTGAIAPVDFTADVAVNGTAATPAEHAASNQSDFSSDALVRMTIPAGDYLAPVELELPGIEILDDSIVEHDETITLGLQNPAAGVTLDGAAPRHSSTITLVDDDEAGYLVSQPAAELAENDSTSFEVRLSAAPLSSVTIAIASDDTTHAGVAPSTLVFHPSTWQTPRTVTVTGVPDDDYDEESLALTIAPEQSSDVFFRALEPRVYPLLITEPALVEDSDDDGLSDAEECPSLPCRDTDGDGTADLHDADDDDDGVPSRDERESGTTDPLVADTDGDGVPDGVEIAEGTPAGPAGNSASSLDYNDEDGDLVPDHVEIADATDPRDASDFVDTDAGGLPDYVETTLFRNAGAPTTDINSPSDDCRELEGDGLPDALELRTDSNFLDIDSPTVNGGGDDDGDSVTNAIEAYLATLTLDVVDADTDFDRDGLPDAFEVAVCSNPLSAQDPDSDNDSVPDSIERLVGADIDNTTDSDGDGPPDVLEIVTGSDRLDANGPTLNGAVDADGDGISNGIEAFLLAHGSVVDTTAETDSDGDSIADATEVSNYSDPFTQLQPVVWIETMQNGLGSRVNRVAADDGAVSARALIGNRQTGDREYDWSATDSAVLALSSAIDTETLDFDPTTLVPGVYMLDARVRRTVAGQASPWSTVRYPLEVIAGSTGEDIRDADADGIPDPDDRSDGRTGSADELQSVATNEDYIVRSERGTKLQLGGTTRTARHVATYVSEADVASHGNGEGFADPLALSDEWDFPIGLHDFEVANLPEIGRGAYIVIPQAAPIPADGTYLKFVPGTGYEPFDASGGDEVASAPGTPGRCPLPSDLDWTEGLGEGHHCIRLTIVDAGPNDADGELNGLIVDPGCVAIAASEPGSEVDAPVDPELGSATPNGSFRTGLQGGGCSIATTRGSLDPLLMLLAFAALAMIRARRPGRRPAVRGR